MYVSEISASLARHISGRLMPYSNMLIRPAEPADAMAVARVHVRSSQVAYQTLMPQDYLDQQRPEDRAAGVRGITVQEIRYIRSLQG